MLRVSRGPTRRLVLCSVFNLLLCAALYGCSWRSLIVLFHSIDQKQCQEPPKLPERIPWRDGATLTWRPVPQCPGAIAYAIDGQTPPLFIAKFHSWKEHIDTIGNIKRCTLITVSDGMNLPSGPLKKESLGLGQVQQAIATATEFSKQLSSLPGFPVVISGYAGEIVSGWDLSADLAEYCRH